MRVLGPNGKPAKELFVLPDQKSRAALKELGRLDRDEMMRQMTSDQGEALLAREVGVLDSSSAKNKFLSSFVNRAAKEARRGFVRNRKFFEDKRFVRAVLRGHVALSDAVMLSSGSVYYGIVKGSTLKMPEEERLVASLWLARLKESLQNIHGQTNLLSEAEAELRNARKWYDVAQIAGSYRAKAILHYLNRNESILRAKLGPRTLAREKRFSDDSRLDWLKTQAGTPLEEWHKLGNGRVRVVNRQTFVTASEPDEVRRAFLYREIGLAAGSARRGSGAKAKVDKAAVAVAKGKPDARLLEPYDNRVYESSWLRRVKLFSFAHAHVPNKIAYVELLIRRRNLSAF